MNRERDTDMEIIAEMRQHISEHDVLSRAGKRFWSLSRYTPPAMFEEFTVAVMQELDRLTAERDAANQKIVSFGSTMADLIMLRGDNERLEAQAVEFAAILEKAVKESKAVVAGYNKAIEERDAARANEARWRERINAIIAIAESYECLAQDPQVETSVSQERLGFAQDIYQALGIETEASE